MSSVAVRMMKGSLWISGARAVVNAAGFFSTIMLARLLAPEDFGLVALGTTILAIMTAVTEMSLSQALVHHKDPQADHFHTAWTLGAARGLLLAAVMTILGRPLAALYEEPRLETLIYAFAFSVFLSGLANPRTVMLSKKLIFWQEFLLSVAERLVSLAVAIGVALHFQSYWALVAGVVVGQFTSVVLSYFILPFRPRIVWRHARELWSFSVWLTLGNAMNTINWRFDQLLVGHLLGRSALGHYTVGDSLAQMPTREAISPLTGTLFPALAGIASDPDRLRAGYQRAQSLITAIALPVGVGFALVAEPLVLLTMGTKWLPAVPIIQALSSVFALQTLGSMAQPLGMALGATKLLFMRDLQMFFVRLPTITCAMLLWGLPGLVYARVFTGLIAACVNMVLVRRLTGLGLLRQLGANFRSLVCVAVMVMGTSAVMKLLDSNGLVHDLRYLAAAVSSGAALYLSSSALLWMASGRPVGPEREFVSLASKLLSQVRRAAPAKRT
ncbi:lipopolysaccharide biosynthesis protein [Devosia sp. 919]|uniref:lipopolysaccharide biosynthesis protein n=1 Tax=Devosia sp. 919 TaxID=2726065 RepID=UPI0015542C2C|nr:lipopolysaccharide biosynthesis protein [Devosia sp. 919]